MSPYCGDIQETQKSNLTQNGNIYTVLLAKISAAASEPGACFCLISRVWRVTLHTTGDETLTFPSTADILAKNVEFFFSN